MSKMDKVLEKASPIAKGAAKETIKFTGRSLKKAGKGIKETGSNAIDNYKEKKAAQIGNRIEELKEKYPEGAIIRPYSVEGFSDRKRLEKMGLKKYVKDPGLFDVTDLSKLTKVIVNQDNEVQYKIHGDYDAEIKRYFAVLGQGINKIGSVNEHQKLLDRLVDNQNVYETIKYGNAKLVLYDDYSFDNPSLSIEKLGSSLSESHFIVSNLSGPMMEIDKVRGRELIAIADKSFMDECVMIYVAIDLIRTPSPGMGEA